MRLKALLLSLFLYLLQNHTVNAAGFWSFDWFPTAVQKVMYGSIKIVESKANTTGVPANKSAIASNIVGNCIKRDTTKSKESNFWENSKIPPHCEEAVLLPLAKLKVVSPEKIIELITSNDIDQTCYRVGTTVRQVNKAIEKCAGFPPNHLYKKLNDGLEHFNNVICKDLEKKDGKKVNKPKTKKHLIDYKECLNQLQDELYDCEGPADWFEKRNTTIACQFYNDIIDCNYVKAAMLCGNSAARLVRDFSDSIMRKVLTFRCKKSRAIPHVESPMIDRSSDCEFSVWVLLFSLGLIYFLA